jgi:hypothetical protein
VHIEDHIDVVLLGRVHRLVQDVPAGLLVGERLRVVLKEPVVEPGVRAWVKRRR